MPDGPTTEGLHVFRVDTETGTLTPIASYTPGLNVGNFAIDSTRGILYVTDEVASNAEFRQKTGAPSGGGGRVFAFSIDFTTGHLTEVGHWPSYGTQPAGIALDTTGNFLVVSHFTSRNTSTKITGNAESGYTIEPRYDDATTVLFPINADGHLGKPCDVYVHATGAGTSPSCLHSVTLSRTGSFFVECDMAKDQLLTFVIDHVSSSLRLKHIHHSPQGSGPRYSVFHPTLSVFYVNYEYEPTIETFSYSESGDFHSIGKVDVLPADLNQGPTNLLSDICAHPSGRYVYTLVRGHNVVSAFAVDDTTGSLRRIQTAVIAGVSPKGCATSPDGNFLYIALSVSNQVQVWQIGDNGLLTSTGQTITVQRPGPMKIIDGTSI